MVVRLAHRVERPAYRPPARLKRLKDLDTTRHRGVGLGVLLVIVLAAAWTSGCGSDKSTPTTPTPSTTTTIPSPPPSTNIVSRLTITGNISLTAIGETSQLTATATLNDNSTKDVTNQGRWQALDARVITVNQGGLLVVTGLGATWVAFTYQSTSATVQVTSTPPGTFVISGRVREPGVGGLPNVQVVDTISRRSAITDVDGLFSLAELSQRRAHLTVQKEGYEPAEIDATDVGVDLPVQQVVRLTAGETVTAAKLAPNDLSYTIGGTRCSPCRLIRVVVPRAGSLHIRTTWTTTSKLSLFIEGQMVDGTGEMSADATIGGPREVLVYLGALSADIVRDHTPFTIETSMR